jgi:hypothetical protein
LKHFLLNILLCLTAITLYGQGKEIVSSFDFYGGKFNLRADQSVIVDFSGPVSGQTTHEFYNTISGGNYQPVIDSLISYREKQRLDDWIFYQLIRRTAQQISPKAENYERYTLYKWFFLSKSGFDAKLGLTNGRLIFYVRCDEDIADIPFYTIGNKQYMCLNAHDYPEIDLRKNAVYPTSVLVPGAEQAFSYKVTRLPDFKPENYTEKTLKFSYRQKAYHFKVMLNPEVQHIFSNYPVVDFESYFNIPLSGETYSSLIPALREAVKGMSKKKGVDYLMRFTRNAFLYQDDEENFGREKRMTPEQTLLYGASDCDDRTALFFYLVKEIYNLPMIALLYPTHITMAVQFDKPIGKPIVYNGKKYSVCEPTPQPQDLKIGQLPAGYRSVSYQIVYQYVPPGE